MTQEIPLKEFLAREGMKHHVSPAAIFDRLRKQPNAVPKRRVNRRVIYVPITAEAPLPRPYRRIHNFSAVDWSQNDCAIARQIGCDSSTVRYFRRRLGKPASPGGKGTPKYSFGGVDWTQPDSAIAAQVGCHVATVYYARRRLNK